MAVTHLGVAVATPAGTQPWQRHRPSRGRGAGACCAPDFKPPARPQQPKPPYPKPGRILHPPPIALDPGAVPPRGAGPDQAGHCRLWADGTGSLGPQDAQARESCALVPRQNACMTVSPVTLGVSCHLKPPSPPRRFCGLSGQSRLLGGNCWGQPPTPVCPLGVLGDFSLCAVTQQALRVRLGPRAQPSSPAAPSRSSLGPLPPACHPAGRRRP